MVLQRRSPSICSFSAFYHQNSQQLPQRAVQAHVLLEVLRNRHLPSKESVATAEGVLESTRCLEQRDQLGPIALASLLVQGSWSKLSLATHWKHQHPAV